MVLGTVRFARLGNMPQARQSKKLLKAYGITDSVALLLQSPDKYTSQMSISNIVFFGWDFWVGDLVQV